MTYLCVFFFSRSTDQTHGDGHGDCRPHCVHSLHSPQCSFSHVSAENTDIKLTASHLHDYIFLTLHVSLQHFSFFIDYYE